MHEIPELIADKTIRELAVEGILPSRYLGNGNRRAMADIWHTFPLDEQEQIVSTVETIEAEWQVLEAVC